MIEGIKIQGMVMREKEEIVYINEEKEEKEKKMEVEEYSEIENEVIDRK